MTGVIQQKTSALRAVIGVVTTAALVTLAVRNDKVKTRLGFSQNKVARRLLGGPDISAIATLIPDTPNDLRDFCLGLRSLESLAVDDVTQKAAPVFAFNEGDISFEQKDMIRSCTDRPVYFPEVEFDFPPGFNEAMAIEDKITKSVSQGGQNLGRPAWGYAQMIRFWTSRIWKHPALQGYDTIMRIDTDSCFVNGGDPEDLNLPGMMKRYQYRSKGPGTGINQWIDGLYDFAVDHMKKEGITPSNPDLWKIIEDTWNEKHTLRTVGTNFEVSRLAFFQREDVAKWLDALTETPPYGVFRYRWGDAQTRVLTLAMFGTKDNILLKVHPGYKHGREFIQRGVMGPSLCAQYFNQYGRIDGAAQ